MENDRLTSDFLNSIDAFFFLIFIYDFSIVRLFIRFLSFISHVFHFQYRGFDPMNYKLALVVLCLFGERLLLRTEH